VGAFYGVCKGLDGKQIEGTSQVLRSNPQCVCSEMQAMFCTMGHMLECHYGMSCSEADCSHYQREQFAEEDL